MSEQEIPDYGGLEEITDLAEPASVAVKEDGGGDADAALEMFIAERLAVAADWDVDAKGYVPPSTLEGIDAEANKRIRMRLIATLATMQMDKERIERLESSKKLRDEIHFGQLKMAADLSESKDEMLTQLRSERDSLKAAIAWALGENGPFLNREEGQGLFWWRTELRQRASISHPVRSVEVGERPKKIGVAGCLDAWVYRAEEMDPYIDKLLAVINSGTAHASEEG